MERLEYLLDELRQAVRAADFAAIALMAPRLEAALAELAGASDRKDAAKLARIKAKAEGTAPLIVAARRGIAAARRRLEDARRAVSGLQTYDMRGQRAEFSPAGPVAGRF